MDKKQAGKRPKPPGLPPKPTLPPKSKKLDTGEKQTETMGWPISKFTIQENSFQFDINKDRLLEFIADQKGNITGFKIQREIEDVTPDGPGEKWSKKRATGRKTIIIEISHSPREKQPPESPSKAQTQPHPYPSLGGKA